MIDFYLHVVFPALGRLITGASDAYAYLPDSTAHFVTAEALAEHMRQAGFTAVSYTRLMFGTMAIHRGTK